MKKDKVKSKGDARAVLLNFLSRRDYSKYELKEKMRTKGFSVSDIDFELDFLEKEGLQSDKRFAECYARFRGAKGFGPYRVERELIQKKVNKDVIDEVMLSMEEMFEGFHKEFILKNSKLDPRVLRNKLFQRGFKSDLLDGCEQWN